MDFLSTWLGTPNLILEANPLAKRLRWKWGIVVNVIISILIAQWPLPAIIITTTSLLVAARNLQQTWLMRVLGEENYRFWLGQRLRESPLGIYLFCLFGQTFLVAAIGLALMRFSYNQLEPFGIGMGILTYAAAVLFYTLLSVWRLRRG